MLSSSPFTAGAPIAAGSVPITMNLAGAPKMAGGRRRRTHCKKGGRSRKHNKSRKSGKSRKYKR